jgi:3-oxoacyl-[acyl-carrier protein] reductase
MIAGNPKAQPEIVPVGRIGTAREVAEVVVILARNGCITGHTVSINLEGD